MEACTELAYAGYLSEPVFGVPAFVPEALHGKLALTLSLIPTGKMLTYAPAADLICLCKCIYLLFQRGCAEPCKPPESYA